MTFDIDIWRADSDPIYGTNRSRRASVSGFTVFVVSSVWWSVHFINSDANVCQVLVLLLQALSVKTSPTAERHRDYVRCFIGLVK